MYFNWLQVGRFFAAFWVIMKHGHWQLFSPASIEAPHNPVYGHYGVDFFFILSGFIITVTGQNYFKRPDRLGEFFIKRFARIYPLVFLLCLPRVVLELAGGSGLSEIISQFISDVLLLPSNSKHMINTAWSLRFEMFFYLAFGFLMILGKRIFWSTLSVMVVLILFYNFSGAQFEGVDRYLFSKWNILFIVGCLIGEVEPWLRKRANYSCVLTVGSMILGGVMLYTSGLSPDHAQKTIVEIIWSSIFFGGAVIGLCCLDYKGVKAPKIFILLGNASYCMYLLHGSILFQIRTHIDSPFIKCALSWGAVAAVLVMSRLIYHYYERWCNDLLRKRFLTSNKTA